MDIRFKEPQRHRAVLIDGQAGRESFLECLLGDRGITVVARYAAAGEVAGLRQLPECDLIILCVRALSEQVGRALGQMSERFGRPVLVISETDAPGQVEAAVSAGASAVLCIGPSTDRLGSAVASAISIHDRLQGFERRAVDAERRLEDRKLVERAKSILMQQRGISEPDAFRQLQRTSMDRNETLAHVARSVIAAKELLG